MSDDENWSPPTDRINRWFGHRDRNGRDDIAYLQDELRRIGFDPAGDARGMFGPATEAAVRMFQREAGIYSTGVVDEIVWLNLVSWPTPE